MLFDIQGKRRRVVQATYLTLAVLMGGGLVLFGIGGDVSGGLFDAFSSGGGSGNDVVEERVEDNENQVKSNPKDEAARKELVRDYFSLASSQASDQGVYPADAQDELRNASKHWKAYVVAETGNPDPSLARLALQLYDPTALNQPAEAVKAARIVAEDSDNTGTYGQLVQYALLAGDKRTEKLASQKAIALAPPKQRKSIRKQLEQLKAQVIAQQLQESGQLDTTAPPAGGGQTQGSQKPSGGK
jgi:hypothetical protein